MAETRHYLREWRQHRGLTQAQVVDRLAAIEDPKLPSTEASLSRIETGAQIYTERVLLALADIYSCESWELIGRNPAREGQLVDLLARLSPAQQVQARAVIEGLIVAEQRQSFTPADEPGDRLKPRKAG